MNLARDYNGYARKRYHFHVHDCRKKGKVVKTENSWEKNINPHINDLFFNTKPIKTIYRYDDKVMENHTQL
jgi:hypothetical protein